MCKQENQFNEAINQTLYNNITVALDHAYLSKQDLTSDEQNIKTNVLKNAQVFLDRYNKQTDLMLKNSPFANFYVASLNASDNDQKIVVKDKI